ILLYRWDSIYSARIDQSPKEAALGTPSLHIENQIATISLERPEKANSLTQQDLQRLGQCIAEIDADPEVLVVRIVARGRHFCGGYDISSLAELGPGVEAVEFGDVV